MNVLVFGWYHHRNAGDDRLQQCITRWLDGHTLAFLPAGRVPPLELLRSYDAAIIGGGGMIMDRGGVFQRMARWVRAARIPAALLGVSVERLPEDLRHEIAGFLECCCFAWFRDAESLASFGPHPKAFVAPDFTWLHPFPLLPRATFPEAIALCLRRHRGLDLGRWKAALDRSGRRVRPWPLYFEGGGDADALAEVAAGDRLPDEFTLAPLVDAPVAVSMRLHGVLFSLQSGRPAIAIGSQPKIARFMKDQGLDEWWLPESDVERLPELLDHLRLREDAERERALTLRERLTEQTRRHAETARELLEMAVRNAAAGSPLTKVRRFMTRQVAP